ncbi:MAG: hypothetical protein N2235_25995 [Fischerella sp.]|nr:hypothetical protein [Fischerella sp.]
MDKDIGAMETPLLSTEWTPFTAAKCPLVSFNFTYLKDKISGAASHKQLDS